MYVEEHMRLMDVLLWHNMAINLGQLKQVLVCHNMMTFDWLEERFEVLGQVRRVFDFSINQLQNQLALRFGFQDC